MSKKKTIIIIAVIAAVAAVVICVLSFTKTEWSMVTDNYGPLNIMELDENVLSNNSEFGYTIEGRSDIKVEGSFLIAEGTVKISAYLNGDLADEETYTQGSYNETLAEFSSVKGDIQVDIEASDDVAGNYTITIDSRKTRLNQIISNF